MVMDDSLNKLFTQKKTPQNYEYPQTKCITTNLPLTSHMLIINPQTRMKKFSSRKIAFASIIKSHKIYPHNVYSKRYIS